MCVELNNYRGSWRCEGAKPCPLKLEILSIAPRQGDKSESDRTSGCCGSGSSFCQPWLKGISGGGEQREVSINILTVLCCSGDKTKILGFFLMRLLHSLVFLISAGKNHSLAFMSFASEWREDHKRDSKALSGEYLGTLSALL